MASRTSWSRSTGRSSNAFLSARPLVLGIFRLLSMGFASVSAAPLSILEHHHDDESEGPLWVLYVTSLVLVLLGGAFAGLTIALMGQDGIYLQVLAKDHTEPQQKNAKRVYDLLMQGKHWVLVTLLLSNVIVNETLPVVLDRTLGGGIAAVVGSTVLIVIFGEILPQSICVRYGLQIGGFMSKPVLVLMWLTAPIAWPTAKLLDKLLGEDHGTVYKKSGLKTLVTLHKSLGEGSDRLNQDEVTIISAVLDLKGKSVESVMTPMGDVFTMAEDTVLDEDTMDMILHAGYSRIPIHQTGHPTNFLGMLLVKILITYDPEDCKPVREFPLATLPETAPETSCLDIVNFFQEGKSHMVLVSENPGDDHGALGVVTLEDVIEELIGEEIIDESDVYIDVHKAIRRLTPAPRTRVQRRLSETHGAKDAVETPTASGAEPGDSQRGRSARLDSLGGRSDTQALGSSPRATTFMMRRSSAGIDGQALRTTVPVRANIQDIKQHLRHLGPSNPATNPKGTRSTTVKIKPGHAGVGANQPRAASISGDIIQEAPNQEDSETTALLRPQLGDIDGVQAVRHSYGSVGAVLPTLGLAAITSPTIAVEDAEQRTPAKHTTVPAPEVTEDDALEAAVMGSNQSDDSVGSLKSDYSSPVVKRSNVRSGSITENVIESGGVRKVVLQTTSSADEDDAGATDNAAGGSPQQSKNASRSVLSLFSTNRKSDEEEDDDEHEGNGGASDQRGDDAPQPPGKKKSRRKKRKGVGSRS